MARTVLATTALATTATATVTARLAASDRVQRSRGSVRLTRRGRVVVVILLLMFAGMVLAFASSAGNAAAPAKPAPVVVVRPGESLWTIATRYLPGRDAPAAVERLRRLNGLDGYTVFPGERLRLPITR